MSALADRIELLISTCRQLDRERRDLNDALEATRAENAHLRQLLASTHERVSEVSQQIRQLEEQSST